MTDADKNTDMTQPRVSGNFDIAEALRGQKAYRDKLASDWFNQDPFLPPWVEKLYLDTFHALDPDLHGFLSRTRTMVTNLYRMARTRLTRGIITEGKPIGDRIADELEDALREADTQKILSLTEKHGKGVLVTPLPDAKGPITLMAEIRYACALDKTHNAFSNSVIEGKLLLDTLESVGIDLDKMINCPIDDESAKEVVNLLTSDNRVIQQWNDFKTAAHENTKWQKILEGAAAVERTVEQALGEHVEFAQNMSHFSEFSANDLEEVCDGWIDTQLKNSAFAWGVMRLVEWPKVVTDFNKQITWVCDAVHAHSDDKETALTLRSSVIPKPKIN